MIQKIGGPHLRALLLFLGQGLAAADPPGAGAGPPTGASGTSQPPPRSDRREWGRDPFEWPDEAPEAARPPGLGGVRILEAVVRGVVLAGGVRSGGTREGGFEPAPDRKRDGVRAFAVVESPSGEGFVVRPGDRLMDGVLHQVRGDGILFRPDPVRFDPVRPELETGNETNRTIFRPLAVP